MNLNNMLSLIVQFKIELKRRTAKVDLLFYYKGSHGRKKMDRDYLILVGQAALKLLTITLDDEYFLSRNPA